MDEGSPASPQAGVDLMSPDAALLASSPEKEEGGR